MNVLIAEDEVRLANAIAQILRENKYQVDVTYNGKDALAYVTGADYDVFVCDVMLPGMDGFQIVHEARKQGVSTPIIMLTARTSLSDKVTGLDAGADDYLTKPFGTEELLARIRAAIRHTRTPDGAAAVANSGVFTAGDLTIDYGKHRVYISGRDAGLTQNEYKLVALLGLHAGKVLTYDYLIKELWGPSARSDNQILRVNMANIRRKIEKNPAQPAYIFTESGVGYRMIEGD